MRRGLGDVLDRLGVIEERRLWPTLDLAWPRVVTGFAYTSQTVADLLMVGLVLGPAALAGMGFAYAYFQIGNQIALGVAGGTISIVAQRYGADDVEEANLAVKQSVWFTLALAIPLAACYYVGAVPLIRVFGADATTVAYGVTYLQLIAFAVTFESLNKIASRVYASVSDTVTPMVVRAGGATLNIALNAVFIFGLGMGVRGAALGTVLATVGTTALLAWGILGQRYPVLGGIPLRFRLGGPQWDGETMRRLVSVSLPLIARRVASSLVAFPLLAVAAVFGTTVVAALEVGRRVRLLLYSLSWGTSIASSSLVGQYLGADDEAEAEGYGWDILRLAVVAYLALTLVVVVLSRPIAGLFVDGPAVVTATQVFVVAAAVSALGQGIDAAATGALRGSGDTRWPLYGKLIGLYVFAVPVAYLGTVTALGVAGLYLAMAAETFVPAVVTTYRWQTNKWKAVSRGMRSTPGD